MEVIGLLSSDYLPASIIHCHLEHNSLLGTWLAWIKTPFNKQGWVRVRWLQKKTKLLCMSSCLVISGDLKRNTWKFIKGWGKSRSNLIQHFRVSLNVTSDLKNSKGLRSVCIPPTQSPQFPPQPPSSGALTGCEHSHAHLKPWFSVFVLHVP